VTELPAAAGFSRISRKHNLNNQRSDLTKITQKKSGSQKNGGGM
jgi:hypothetical protein